MSTHAEAWLSFASNPLSLTLYGCSAVLAVIWHAFPWDGGRYVMGGAANVAPLLWAAALSLVTFLASVAASWWLRLGGKVAVKDDVYSSVRLDVESRPWRQRLLCIWHVPS